MNGLGNLLAPRLETCSIISEFAFSVGHLLLTSDVIGSMGIVNFRRVDIWCCADFAFSSPAASLDITMRWSVWLMSPQSISSVRICEINLKLNLTA